MWLKLCVLLVYLLLLFLLSRMLDVIAWCESGHSGSLTRQLLDPMVLSVAKLKALLENRGVSYEGVVEKSELSTLVKTSGQVTSNEVDVAQLDENPSADTNFTSGSHFIEQVEDAKDSVWLVQVVSHSGKHRVLSEAAWRNIRRRASKFGMRTGMFDCSLDIRYCVQRRWHSPFLLLAMPSQFEKKASVAMYNYSGSVRETVVLRWVRDRLNERIAHIEHPEHFRHEWGNLQSNALTPEIKAVLFTEAESTPLFFSALSVKFPGRVKFGLVSFNSSPTNVSRWQDILIKYKILKFPAYVVITAENSYIFGPFSGEIYSFSYMELFLKVLYPCLNDVFIISFCLANVITWFELFVSNCSLFRRIRKFFWCLLKYNMIVIMLWLPINGIFQMPYLDRVPLLALKVGRVFSLSFMGKVFRADYLYFHDHLSLVCLSFAFYLAIVTFLCKKFREEDEEDNWFNFSQMRTLTHLRSNEFFEPMRIGGYDLMGGFEVFGSHLSQPSLWLQPSVNPEYIQRLLTWRFCPTSMATRAAQNTEKVKEVLKSCKCDASHYKREAFKERRCNLQTNAIPAKSSNFLDGQTHSSINFETTVSGASQCFPNEQGTEDFKGEEIQKKRSQCALMSCQHCQTKNVPDNTKLKENLSHCDDPVPKINTSSGSGQCRCVRSTACPNTIRQTQTQSIHSEVCSGSAISSKNEFNGFPAGYLESHQCVICLEEYIPLTMLCGLPCGHVFHESCIISWLNREKHFCPMCRWPAHISRPLNSTN